MLAAFGVNFFNIPSPPHLRGVVKKLDAWHRALVAKYDFSNVKDFPQTFLSVYLGLTTPSTDNIPFGRNGSLCPK